MGGTKQIADQFLGWWLDPGSNPGFPRRFAQGFTYRQEPAGLADSDAIWFIEQKLPWSKVDVEVQEVDGNMALIVINGVDPVTDLRHKVSWKIVVRGDQIVSVLERMDTIE